MTKPLETENIELSDKQKKAQRSRSIAIAVVLVVLVAIFYFVTILKMGPAVMVRPL
ncbi:MAG: hypothetical protein L3J32_00740 [Rhizobiaceae bacterium]|nr:hypothetical protein [Rhizobiaceae bacterium]